MGFTHRKGAFPCLCSLTSSIGSCLFICGGVATVLGLMWRWGKAMVNGLRELLLCQLEDLRREMVIEHDGVADEDLKSRSQRLYDSYHSLGGNGHGTSLNNDIQSAPIAPRQS